MTPPLGENGALDSDAFDVTSVRRHLDRGQHVGDVDPNRSGGARIDVHASHITHESARRGVELLTLPLVHMRPDRMAVGARKARVHADDRLDVVVLPAPADRGGGAGSPRARPLRMAGASAAT